MLNLDTHILLYAVTGALTAREARLLRGAPWSASVIVLWEIAKLAQLGRIEIDLESPRLLRVISRLQIWPIDLAVCRALAALDFQGDPADELIAATSIVHRVPLLTRDRAIRHSRRVPLA
jgi:PIN domain nuclease of toxin-antitoxin system